MAYTEIVITKMKDHLVSMLLKDHQPVEFQCVSEKAKIEIGNIYTGIVKNVVKNINGAFVEFDEDEMGFLSMQHKQYKAGGEVLVQIKKERRRKTPMLSDQIELTGKYLVLTSDKLSVGISNKIHEKDKKQELREMAEPLVTQEYGFILVLRQRKPIRKMCFMRRICSQRSISRLSVRSHTAKHHSL